MKVDVRQIGSRYRVVLDIEVAEWEGDLEEGRMPFDDLASDVWDGIVEEVDKIRNADQSKTEQAEIDRHNFGFDVKRDDPRPTRYETGDKEE